VTSVVRLILARVLRSLERYPATPGFRDVLILWGIVFSILSISNALAGKWFLGVEGLAYGRETTAIARSLLAHGTFSDPYSPMPTGPTTHVGPLYPLFYAAVMGVFGSGEVFGWAIRLLTLAALALHWALLPLAASRLGIPAAAGLLATLLGTLIGAPTSLYNQDAAFVCLLLTALLCLIGPARDGAFRTPRAIAAGLLWGVACLLSPILLPVWIAWGVVLFVRVKPLHRRNVAFLGLAILVMAPWLIRNRLVFGQSVFIRGNTGLEMAASNNDCASASWQDNLRSGCYTRWHPNESPEQARRVAAIGEVRFNLEQRDTALAWIRERPTRFLVLCVQRFGLFWLHWDRLGNKAERYDDLLIWLFTILSIPGGMILWRERRFAATLLFSAMLLYSIPYFFVMNVLRYRFPILWISVLLTAIFLQRVLRPRHPSGC
jgi:hypothetical protein